MADGCYVIGKAAEFNNEELAKLAQLAGDKDALDTCDLNMTFAPLDIGECDAAELFKKDGVVITGEDAGRRLEFLKKLSSIATATKVRMFAGDKVSAAKGYYGEAAKLHKEYDAPYLAAELGFLISVMPKDLYKVICFDPNVPRLHVMAYLFANVKAANDIETASIAALVKGKRDNDDEAIRDATSLLDNVAHIKTEIVECSDSTIPSVQESLRDDEFVDGMNQLTTKLLLAIAIASPDETVTVCGCSEKNDTTFKPGEVLHVSDEFDRSIAGKKTLVLGWEPGCSSCTDTAIPELKKLEPRIIASGSAIAGLVSTEDAANEEKTRWPNTVIPKELYEKLPSSVPFFYIVDEQGTILEVFIPEYIEDIKQLEGLLKKHGMIKEGTSS